MRNDHGASNPVRFVQWNAPSIRELSSAIVPASTNGDVTVTTVVGTSNAVTFTYTP